MSGIAQEIVTSYETLGMSIEEIAQDTGMEIAAVKAILFQSCAQFRKDAKSDESLQFTLDEAEECKKIVMNIARYSEDEHLQFKAARYVLDAKTGRLEAGKQLQNVSFNVIAFNEQMQRAMMAAEKTAKKVIDVNTETRQLVGANK